MDTDILYFSPNGTNSKCNLNEKFHSRCKLEHEEYVKSIKRECENILVATRKSAEKHFHEIVKLYEEARDKVIKKLFQKNCFAL